MLGGFVPDATEAVLLLRRTLLRFGSLYCFNYPRRGFSNELLFAQLDDRVDELSLLHGRPPVILAISFGAGLVIQWLTRAQRGASRSDLRGLVLISPVVCVEDLLPWGDTQPRTLIGRALKPYLEPGAVVETKPIEETRAVFQKMFEAGAQNQEALCAILLRDELEHLRCRARSKRSIFVVPASASSRCNNWKLPPPGRGRSPTCQS